MGQKVFSLFQTSLANLRKSKAQLLRHFSASLKEIQDTPFWEFELLIKDLKEILQDEKRQREKEQKEAERKRKAQENKQRRAQKMPNLRKARKRMGY